MTNEQFNELVIKGVDFLGQLGQEAKDLEAAPIDMVDLLVNIVGLLVFEESETKEYISKFIGAFMERFFDYVKNVHGVHVTMQIKGEKK